MANSTSLRATQTPTRGEKFAANWTGGARADRSTRRRIMAILRASCMTLGFSRKNVGLGALGASGRAPRLTFGAAGVTAGLALGLPLAFGSAPAFAADAVCVNPSATTTAVGTASGAGNEVACGDSAVASGANSIAVGASATTSTADGIAIGHNAIATTAANNPASAMAIGLGAKANVGNGISGIAIGTGATTDANGAVTGDLLAIGNGAIATGQNNVAIGGMSNAGAQQSVAVGQSAFAGTSQTTAIGFGSSVNAVGGTALGMNAQVTTASGVALGAASATSPRVSTSSTVINGKTYNFAGNFAFSTVSIGNDGTNGQFGAVSLTATSLRLA